MGTHPNPLTIRKADHPIEPLFLKRWSPRAMSGEPIADSELMRLFRSLVKRGLLARVGPRGCARFFSAYCGDDRRLRAAMWRRVPAELRKVELHRVGYRASRRR